MEEAAKDSECTASDESHAHQAIGRVMFPPRSVAAGASAQGFTREQGRHDNCVFINRHKKGGEGGGWSYVKRFDSDTAEDYFEVTIGCPADPAYGGPRCVSCQNELLEKWSLLPNGILAQCMQCHGVCMPWLLGCGGD